MAQAMQEKAKIENDFEVLANWLSSIPATELLADYLAYIESFLTIEAQKHLQNLKAIEEKIESGEIASPRDPHQMPDEMSFDYHGLDRIE